MRLLPWLFRFQSPVRLRWSPPPPVWEPPSVTFAVMRPITTQSLTEDSVFDLRPLLVDITVGDAQNADEAMGYIHDLIENGACWIGETRSEYLENPGAG
ncbi:hypothetical protein LCGC14_0695280 [marine sediment metagenome]|uniref:Uncharacterized protein n=1 Tax=marine sediment metagenome TaxID=412755 RepID=A0A0F9R4M1_9ZZZZ